MHDELFKVPAVVARYRAGPYVESREQFLKKARTDGYSPATLERIAWALLVVAEIVHRDGGSITSKRLRRALLQHVRPNPLDIHHLHIPSDSFFRAGNLGCAAWVR
jgi:hypothetical protein